LERRSLKKKKTEIQDIGNFSFLDLKDVELHQFNQKSASNISNPPTENAKMAK